MADTAMAEQVQRAGWLNAAQLSGYHSRFLRVLMGG